MTDSDQAERPLIEKIQAERTGAAQRVAGVFASLHQFLDTLKFENEQGEKLMSEMLRNAHARIEEANTWAVKHVLTFGAPPVKTDAAVPENSVAPEKSQ